MSRTLPSRRPAHARAAAFCAAALLAAATSTHAGILRVATYNIEADIDGYTTPRPGLSTVLEAIGSQSVAGNARPLDLLALEETTSNATTVAPIVSSLNAYYGSSATYAQSTVQATQAGSNTTGNGPNAIIYNSQTLSLLNSVGIGTPLGSNSGAGSGMYRQVMRYQFQPVGGAASSIFYVYVSHAKSGTGSDDLADRGKEATLIRNNISALPASANIMVMGDLNLTNASEALFTTLTAAGNAKLSDPLGTAADGDWDKNAAFKSILTESATALDYRDDFQLDNASVLDNAGGLDYIPGSYHTFGINGTTAVGKSVNLSTNTALNALANGSAVLADLTTASDHLPVVADYTFTAATPIPEPTPAAALTALPLTALLTRRRRP